MQYICAISAAKRATAMNIINLFLPSHTDRPTKKEAPKRHDTLFWHRYRACEFLNFFQNSQENFDTNFSVFCNDPAHPTVTVRKTTIPQRHFPTGPSGKPSDFSALHEPCRQNHPAETVARLHIYNVHHVETGTAGIRPRSPESEINAARSAAWPGSKDVAPRALSRRRE